MGEPYVGRVVAGAGGASKAFVAEGGRRTREIAAVVGYTPHPGTLNLRLDQPFDFSAPHLSGVVDAKRNPVRFYPVMLDGRIEGHVIRFAKKYSPSYIGIIAPIRLRDHVGATVTVRHRQ